MTELVPISLPQADGRYIMGKIYVLLEVSFWTDAEDLVPALENLWFKEKDTLPWKMENVMNHAVLRYPIG